MRPRSAAAVQAYGGISWSLYSWSRGLNATRTPRIQRGSIRIRRLAAMRPGDHTAGQKPADRGGLDLGDWDAHSGPFVGRPDGSRR